jgi:hypothetical protein
VTLNPSAVLSDKNLSWCTSPVWTFNS